MNPIPTSLTALSMIGLLAACQEEHHAEAPAPRPVLTVVAAPQTARTVGFAGTVEPRYKSDLGFRVLGRVISRDVNVSDVVRKGQRLATLDPLTYQLAVRSAQADLVSATARLENAAATESRQRTLLQQNITTQAQYDAAKQARESAEAGVTSARANLDKAEEQLGYAELRAEFDGVVTATEAELGQVVQPGQTVVSVARPDIREAVVDLPESIGRDLRPGARFDIALQVDPSVRAAGSVREIAPQADPATRTRRVRITLDNPPESFRLGTTITASVTTTGCLGHRAAGLGPAGARRQDDGLGRRSGHPDGVDPGRDDCRPGRIRRSDPGRAYVRHPLGHRRREQPDPQPNSQDRRRGLPMNSRFNLSDWALEHRSLVWYFMIVFGIAGIFAYINLGREEDPSFTIKTMVIAAQWPGATVEETSLQVTDRIEKKLEELDSLDYTRSQTTPGQTVIYVNLKDTTKARDVPGVWVKVRNMVNDVKRELPQGVVGPVFNDDFGDVYGNVYAFTADGLTQRQMRDYVEDVRAKVLTVPNVGKVNLIGAQDEAIFLEFSTREMAALGISQQDVIQTLQAQNAITPSGVIQAGPERISVRVTGQFTSEESLRDLNLRINDRFFRLSDVATISRGYVDPPQALFRFKGQPAIGLAIGMKTGANLLHFGEALQEQMDKIIGELPIGVGVHLVADQPIVVEEAVGGFTKALFEAVAIVLVVSFLSLGMRAGFVVALSIPLVLAMTFVVMQYTGISLQRISLGALIIALGLLVDDAMIAVEMMVARLEAGDTLRKAATAVYTSTAFPMLTGTLVTVASFIPVGLNSSNAGEFTFTLFVVIAASLLLSWIVAVLFAPLLGVTLLPKTMKKHHDKPSRLMTAFSRVLVGAMRWRWLTIGVTVAMFGVSLYGMKFVEQQFFPSSDRNELLVDFTLPQNAAITDTKAQMDRFEAKLAGDPDIDHWSSYVGQSAVRFILSFDPQPSNPNYGQMVIVTKSIEARERLRAKIKAWARQEFAGLDVYIGPAGGGSAGRTPGAVPAQRAGRPESAGPGAATRSSRRRAPPGHQHRLQLERACPGGEGRRAPGQGPPARRDLAGHRRRPQQRRRRHEHHPGPRRDLSGRRGGPGARRRAGSIETLQNLQLPGKNGQSVPLAAVATFHYELEQPVIWRRSRLPTITIRGSIVDATQPATIVQQLEPKVQEFVRTLPAGYGVAVAGPVEESAKSQGPITAVVPLMLFIMATILMVQLQSFSRLFLVVAVAPLGLIGVVAAMLPSGAPMGFVAILGVLALVGILIRNSVILVVQIEDLRREGWAPWEAVVEATMHRTRPILLTAAAASLALIPISREVFWGPMAYAMMGGIIVGTVLTLVFLPALYVAWFRIKAPSQTQGGTASHRGGA